MAKSRLRPFGHEPMAIATRQVLRIAAAIAASVLIIIAALYWIVQVGMFPQVTRLAARAAAIPPAPRLQAHPPSDLAQLRQQEEASLAGYAWTDATHSTARIPIERAMALYVEKQAAQQAPAPPTRPVMQEPPQ